MGIAAYNRGSASITRGLCRKYGCRGCPCCYEHTPAPRPADWGSKVRAKADRRASGLLSYLRSRGHEITVDDLAHMVREDVRCGKKTAHAAAEAAFEGAP